MSRIQAQMTDNSVSSDWWRGSLRHFLETGNEFEICCWKEETAVVRQASLYGKAVESTWEISVKGVVTAKLLAELLTEEPADKGVYNKMTKYFTINIKNGLHEFTSAHYGTEIYRG